MGVTPELLTKVTNKLGRFKTLDNLATYKRQMEAYILQTWRHEDELKVVTLTLALIPQREEEIKKEMTIELLRRRSTS